jgi:uncharacterized phage protein (TIGR02218 family)
MKSIPLALQAHYDGASVSTCLLCKVTTKDGQTLAFTSLDADLAYDDGTGSVSYLASNGFTPQRFEASADTAVDNTEFQGWVQASGITEAQIRAGLFDFARIVVYRVNYLDLSMGHELVMAGTAGETTFSAHGWRTEFRSKTQQLKQTIAQPYSLRCRAAFGDARCGKALVWVAGTVTSVGAETDRIFSDAALTQADGHFTLGVLRFTSGANTGFEVEVELHADDSFTLVFPTPYPIQEDDDYEVRQDCGKRLIEDCKTVHNNLDNFRGEPFIPVDGTAMVPGAEIQRTGSGGGGK